MERCLWVYFEKNGGRKKTQKKKKKKKEMGTRPIRLTRETSNCGTI